MAAGSPWSLGRCRRKCSVVRLVGPDLFAAVWRQLYLTLVERGAARPTILEDPRHDRRTPHARRTRSRLSLPGVGVRRGSDTADRSLEASGCRELDGRIHE